MNRLLEKLALFIYRYYAAILALSLCLAVGAVTVISRIEVKTDIMDLLPANHQSIRIYKEALNDFRSMKILTALVTSPHEDIERHLDIVETLGSRFSQSPLIEDSDHNILRSQMSLMVKYFPLYLDQKGLAALKKRLSEQGMARQIRHNYSRLASVLSTPLDSELISQDPLNIREILMSTLTKKSKPGFNLNMTTGYYLSNDHSAALIFLTPSDSAQDISSVMQLKKDLEMTVKETLKEYNYRNGLKVEFTGIHALAWESHESISHDMLSSILITVILIIVIFLFLYSGSVIVLPIILGTLFLSLLWTLTGAYVLFGRLNIISAVVSAMLIGLGIDYTLHIYERYREELGTGKSSLQALTTTFCNTGKSVITSGITTAIAFSSIVITSFRGLHELGIIAAMGVLWSVFSSLMIMGSILVFVTKKKKEYFLYCRKKDFLKTTIVIPLTKKGTLLKTIMLILIAVSLPGMLKVRFVSDYSSIGLKNSQALAVQEVLSAQIGTPKAPLLFIYDGEKNIDEAFDNLERTLSQWEKQGFISGYTSPGSLFPPPHKQKTALKIIGKSEKKDDSWEQTFLSLLKKYGFIVTEHDKFYIRGIREGLTIDHVVGLHELVLKGIKKVEYFYNKEKNKLAAYIYPVSEDWTPQTLDNIRKDVKSMGKQWHVTGWPLISDELKKSIIGESIVSAALTFTFIVVIISLYFRKTFMILYTMIPLTSGLIITVGIMGYFSIGFNYINVAAIALLFGIAVDYGIYIMQACREGDYQCDKTIVINAMKNIIICALTTLAGFGSLITTHFSAIASLGLVIIIGVLLSSALSIALPAIIASRTTGQVRK